MLNYYDEVIKLGLTGHPKKEGKSDVFFHCCFHPNDNTPSLSINIDTGLYKCFCCNAKGNFYTLVKHLKGSDYYYEHYSDKQKLSFKKDTFDFEFKIPEKVNEQVLENYKKIHSWALDRINDKDILKHFEIGYDEFRDAITFPIRDNNGVFYNVEYRYLNKSSENKASYLYEFNKKGKILYNLFRAKEFDSCILVEGIFDLLKVYKSGFKNVVCFLGTELTEERKELLNNYFNTLYLFFDNDVAGKRISKEIIAEFIESKELYYLDLSTVNKKDPGECTEQEIQEVFNNKKLIG